MRYLFIYIALFATITCFSQEQITNIHSTKYISGFECLVGTECIIDGDLDGEAFTLYMGFNQVFIDFENESIMDYNIPYTFGCFLRNVMLNGKYLYLLGHSSLVIDIEARRMHDHFSFGEGLSFRDAEISGEGVVIRLVNNVSGRYHYGRYTPETKEKLLSNPHIGLISFQGNYYFTDSILGAFVLGDFTDEEWTEDLIVGGEEFVYLGDGYFQMPDGRLSYGWLDNNPVFTCIPQDQFGVELYANKIYDRANFRIIETYDATEEVYTYYYGSDCLYRKFLTSDYNSVPFDFYNDEYFGFRADGHYVRMQHSNGATPALEFTIASSEDYSSTDKWMMSGDTAYLFTVRYVSNDFVNQVIRYTPGGFLESDIETVIKEYSADANIVRKSLNSSGEIELTFNNSVEGVHVITLSSNGIEINNEFLFYSWDHDFNEKNIKWTANKKGHIRRTQIKPSANYRIDRVEEGTVITDTMLMSPYIDEDIEVSLKENGGNKVLRFYDVITGSDSEIVIPDIAVNSQSKIIKAGGQIWLVNQDNSEENDVFRFGLAGEIIDEQDLNVKNIISYNESGLMYSRRDPVSFLEHVFHYDGEDVKQLTENLFSLMRNIVVGDDQYIMTTSYSIGTTILKYNPETISLLELENFSEYPHTSESVHNSLQTNKSYYAYEPSNYSNVIKHILFDKDGYRIEEFDLEDELFVDYTTSFPFKEGFIYSVRDNMTNIYVDSTGASRGIPIDIEEDFLIRDLQQTEESVYLFGGTYYDVYVIKCDDEFNDCEVIKSFDQGFCQYKDIRLLGENNGEIYFSAAGNNPIESIWTLDTATDEIYLYNTDEETQIQFFERREFVADGYVYFTAARSDQEHQLFRMKVSEDPNAVADISGSNSFVVAPNPTTGNSIITNTLALEGLSIYDSSGRLVSQGVFSASGSYVVPNLRSGFYLIRAVDSTGHMHVSKLMIVE